MRRFGRISPSKETGVRSVRLFIGLAAGVGLLTALLAAAPAHAQDGAVMRIVAPVEEIDASSDEVTVDVVVDNVTNLGAFQFVLTFDEDILEYKSTDRGDFLGSTDREVSCDETLQQGGALRFVCRTLRLEPPGPDGSGKLVTVHFDPKDSGTSALTLTNAKLVTPAAEEMPSTTADAELKVKGGGSNILMIVLIAVGAAVAAVVVVGGAFAMMRGRRSATASAS
jgi:hypothetical protein